MNELKSDFYDNYLNRELAQQQDKWPPYKDMVLKDVTLPLPKEFDNQKFKNLCLTLNDILLEELVSHCSDLENIKKFKHKDKIAALLSELSSMAQDSKSKHAIQERINFVLKDFSPDSYPISELNAPFVFLCGFISTFFGKDTNGRPSAIFLEEMPKQKENVAKLLTDTGPIQRYLSQLHSSLKLFPFPDFQPKKVFFLSGEANTHPKHIAYFMPEDEGIKKSKNKCSYYLSNVHNETLRNISFILHDYVFSNYLNSESILSSDIPLYGVLSHELGHCIFTDKTNYKVFNSYDRWMSVTLQEICADVFGVIIASELWVELNKPDVVGYYLAECLRYSHRGVGYFPDSDGMLFQLSWLFDSGVLVIDTSGSGSRLIYETDMVISALRSLARVLTDSFLCQNLELTVEIYNKYSPLYNKETLLILENLKKIAPISLNFT